MEQELFFSGYCRCLDSSRTVEVIVTDGGLSDIGCGYKSCIHRPACPIAREIDKITE